jgi:hypothetical protein
VELDALPRSLVVPLAIGGANQRRALQIEAQRQLDRLGTADGVEVIADQREAAA